MNYTIRFDRGNRAWTCSVFQLGLNGQTSGPALVSGSGPTRDDAKNAAVALASDPAIRAALEGSDNRRPYWLQDAGAVKPDAPSEPVRRGRAKS
jgi:hypothetical protein